MHSMFALDNRETITIFVIWISDDLLTIQETVVDLLIYWTSKNITVTSRERYDISYHRWMRVQ